MRKLSICFILIFCLSVPGTTIQGAQPSNSWSTPINISRSGAASQPRIVASTDGGWQVFWWDRFDGLMSAVSEVVEGTGLTWSDPFAAPIYSEYLDHTPDIFVDSTGWVHAFWTEKQEPEILSEGVPESLQTSLTSLMHSQSPFGTAGWSFPEVLAESAIAYEVSTPLSGGISLAYIRIKHTSEAPAGVYFKSNEGNGALFGSPYLVYSSIYFRKLTPEQAQVSILDSGQASNIEKRTISIAWYEPHRKEILFSASGDNGFRWSVPKTIGTPEERPEHPRLVLNGKTFLIWQATAQSLCTLYQQEQLSSNQVSNIDDAPVNWSVQQRIFDSLVNCPQADQIWPNGENLVWSWNEGTANLALAIWDSAQLAWSLPLNLSFSFEDSETNQSISLNDLHTALSGNSLAVVGIDDFNGEIWFTLSELNNLEAEFASPGSWSPLIRLSNEGQFPTITSMAIDNKGRTHIVWSEATEPTNAGAILQYALSVSGNPSHPAQILSSSGEAARQPNIFYDSDADLLHLVWSGGKDGIILYSRVKTDEANSPSGWFAPTVISGAEAAAWPQIGQDEEGTLFVLYSVPLNESRGIYLVRSQERGESWTEPDVVFDAFAENWLMVDHPTLAIARNGTLHAAWVQAPLPGTGKALGIYYSRSDDSGVTWSPPLTLAGENNDWPRLALSGGKIHLFYANAVNGSGSLYHRWADISRPSEEGSSWSIPSSIPGFKNVALPYGVTSSGPEDTSQESSPSILHLVGADDLSGSMHYSTWDGEQWSATENLDESEIIEGGLGSNAVTLPEGGTLGIIWLAFPRGVYENNNPVLYFSNRAISTIDLPSSVLPTPQAGTGTVINTPVPPTEIPRIPTTTPDLNLIGQSSSTTSGSYTPLFLGGILAVILVAGLLGGKKILGQFRERGRYPNQK